MESDSGMDSVNEFSMLSDMCCETYAALVNELRDKRPGLASRLDVGRSHTYEVAVLPADEAQRRLQFTELAWEGVLSGKESQHNNISELMSWLAPLRARFSHRIPNPNTPTPNLPWREPVGPQGWIHRHGR